MGKIDCERAIYELYQFLDGELSVERRTMIQVHLDQCSHCLPAYHFEAELRMVVTTHCSEVVPDHLKQAIRGILGIEGT